ncbi:MAG: hypothetical protein WEB58_22310 [Planctomycetaceae bacterium]
MSLTARKRSLRNSKIARQGIIWGGGLFGGCLLGIVVVVLPWATDHEDEAATPDLAAAEVSQPIPQPATVQPEIASAPKPLPQKLASNDDVQERASVLISASDEERRKLARTARRRAAQRSAQKLSESKAAVKKPRFPVPQKLGPGEATLAYWNEMNSIIAEEEQIRAVPFGGLNKFNAQNFLSRRVQSGEFAANALSQLGRAEVDPEAIALAKSLGDWYLRGSKIAQSGETLLVKGNANSRNGAQGNQYKSSELDHSKAVEDINRKGSELQQKLSKKYGLEFPPLK